MWSIAVREVSPAIQKRCENNMGQECDQRGQGVHLQTLQCRVQEAYQGLDKRIILENLVGAQGLWEQMHTVTYTKEETARANQVSYLMLPILCICHLTIDKTNLFEFLCNVHNRTCQYGNVVHSIQKFPCWCFSGHLLGDNFVHILIPSLTQFRHVYIYIVRILHHHQVMQWP